MIDVLALGDLSIHSRQPADAGQSQDTVKQDSSLQQADFNDWHPRRAPGLIFSNAALHWVGGHEALMPRLARMLGKGGTLAVQMPHQNKAPSHRVWLSLVEEVIWEEEVSRSGVPLQSNMLGSTFNLFGQTILKCGTEEQKREFVVPLAKGEKQASFALTEAQAGSDAAALETTATKKGDVYILNGKPTLICIEFNLVINLEKSPFLYSQNRFLKN